MERKHEKWKKNRSNFLLNVMAISYYTFPPSIRQDLDTRPYKTLLFWRQTSESSIGPHRRTFGSAVQTVCEPLTGTSKIRTAQGLVNILCCPKCGWGNPR
ncbi:hypothetical protein AVEN_165881-1 [Araneus ventricosus]|uniref:Uncharacterized protein n=1 Tax=Araneus ventricosus TaxID=182803 RepID=A0A4Y2VMN0_ARAVE|nr:hypothetical protein AVEN_165881-1 [Araneus ventricosus]